MQNFTHCPVNPPTPLATHTKDKGQHKTEKQHTTDIHFAQTLRLVWLKK